MFNEDLINESNNIQHYISRSLYTGFRTIKFETLETSSMAFQAYDYRFNFLHNFFRSSRYEGVTKGVLFPKLKSNQMIPLHNAEL